MELVKQKLLSLGIVNDNEYLDRYCELIISNKDRKREKYKCQQHHIIPVCYFKHNNIIVDDSPSNKVILLHKDHTLAHIFLEKCSKPEWFRHYNGTAVRFALNNSAFKAQHSYADDRLFIESLDIYQEVIEECNRLKSQHFKGHTVSQQTKNKISNSLKGHPISEATRNKLSGYKWYTNGESNIQIREFDVIPEGFHPGRTNPPQWVENVTKSNQSRKSKPGNSGKICIHKDNVICYIDKELLHEYVQAGFCLGRPPVGVETRRKLSSSRNNIKFQPLTEEHKKNISDSLKGRHISDEQKANISVKNKNRKYIYKDGVQKFVPQQELELYLSNGWELGRKSRMEHVVSQETRNKISNKLKGVD